MSYELIEHSADIRILVKAENLELLFQDSLMALAKIMCSKDFNFECYELSEFIEIESIDSTALLIDFLSEALSLMHREKAIFSVDEIIDFTEINLKAKLKGFKINSFDEDVKGVTYHEADVRIIDNLFQTFIILDI